MQKTKQSLITSITALLLCFVMLVGTTFAWFTDVATSANNVIKTGKLDIAMSWSSDNMNWNDTEGANARPVFDYDLWEPGYTEVRYIRVENLGSLAFKYNMAINPTGAVGKLAEVIDVSYDVVTDNSEFTAPTATDKQGSLTKVATLAELIDGDSIVAGGVLLPEGESAQGYYSGEIVVCISFHMQESAGNEYQGKRIGSEFGINLYATQFDYENDSFDNSYDADATWPELDSGYAASTPIDANNLMLGALTSEVTIGGANGIGATVPADVMIADGASSLDLTMKKVDTDGNLKLGDGDSATSFDVHIEGVADGNTVPMIVNLGAVLPTGLLDTELKLYHTENGVPEQMTKVNSAADFALHNQYTYDPATGNVSIYVASFSVFSSVQTTADVWDGSIDASWYNPNSNSFTLATAEQFAGFRAIVDGGYYDAQGVWKKTIYQDSFAGKTVNLGKDIDLKEIPFDPIGFSYTINRDSDTAFMGTFDGGNHTIYNLKQNCWELDPDKTNYGTYTYSTAGGGLFASIEGSEENPVVIKNLAISGAEIVFECVDMGIVVGYAQGVCHFENIVVTNSNIANYNRYTGGVVGEVSYGPYGTDTSLGYSHTFKNITVDSTVTVSGLWGSFGCGMGGVIGGKWGDATVKMENVVSAPVMDVYNDVVSAYQWYAFRGCGMLIGHTEEPYSDGRHSDNATANFLTCEDVTVYYGDWVNYTYYEFENQDSTTGRSYPWVRAEAGKYCDAFSNIRYGVPTHDGVKVSDLTEEELKAIATDYTTIVFDQLYGADRGMYGTASHRGVTVGKISDIATTTVKFQNNGKWDDVKIEYLFAHGEDTWSTLIDGLDATEIGNDGTFDIHTFNIPSIAYAFKIIGTKNGVDVSTNEFKLTDLKDNEIYALNIAGTELVETRKVTFTPDNNWKQANARLTLYAFDTNNHNIWYNLKAEGSNYVCYLPVEYTTSIFCRMNPNGSDKENNYNNWSNVWNQTKDLPLPTDNSDYYYDTIIYLIPNNNWIQSNARFAAYFFKEYADGTKNEVWVSLTDSNKDGIYECIIPLGDWDEMIFCRMNGSTTANNWNNRWNQTANLSIPTTSKEYFYVTDGWWDSMGDGCWSTKK